VSRGGFGSKLHVLTDGKGNVLQVIVTRGNRNECPTLGSLLGSACRNLQRRPTRLAGDKGYSADHVRDGLVACGIQPVIPMRDRDHAKDRLACERRWGKFDKRAYRQRNVVERAIAKLKEFRRIATRYDKLAESFVGMINLACIVRYLRLLDS
jgi:transposase